MGSLKDREVVLHPVFAATFNQIFGEPMPKKVTKDNKPKDKEKKGGKDEENY